MKALLIIDMQVGCFKPYSIRHDALGVIDRINRLSAQFRKKGDKVIFIQFDGSREHCFLPGSEDWQVLPELHREATDICINKTVNDSFYKTVLEDILSAHNITELVITGCATDYCVDATIKSALNKDYKITVIGDGHTTGSKPHLDAKAIIDHYNWIWADMSPTKHKINVIRTNELIGN